MPLDASMVRETFPHRVAIVERSYEADRNVFMIMMLLLLTVILWIAVLLFQPLWDASAPFNWSGVAQICLLLCVAYIVWAQHRVYHGDWPLA